MSQLDFRSEREIGGLDFGVTGGQDLPKQRVQIEEDSVNAGSRSDAKAAKQKKVAKQNSQEMVRSHTLMSAERDWKK